MKARKKSRRTNSDTKLYNVPLNNKIMNFIENASILTLGTAPKIKPIKKRLENILKRYKDEIKKRKLYNFYSRQLDIDEYQKKYKYDYTVKKQFFDLFPNSVERKNAIKVLKNKIEEIHKINDLNLDEYDYLSFLYDYYDIIAEKEVLEDIKDKVKKRNINTWNNYYEDINKKLEKFLSKYKK